MKEDARASTIKMKKINAAVISFFLFFISLGNESHVKSHEHLTNENDKREVTSILAAKAWCHTAKDSIPAEVGGQKVMQSLMFRHGLNPSEAIRLLKSEDVQRRTNLHIKKVGCTYLRYKVDY